MGDDLAEEAQDPPLVAALLLPVGKVEGAPGDRQRGVQPAGQEVRFPEVGEKERMVGGAGRSGIGQRLLQEGHALCEAPGQRIREAEVTSCDIEEDGHGGDPAQFDGVLEWRDGLRDTAAPQEHKSKASIAQDEAGGMLGLAADPNSLLAPYHRLREFSQLGEASGEPRKNGWRSQQGAPRCQIGRRRFGDPAEGRSGESIFFPRLPDQPEAFVHRCLKGRVVVADGEGPLTLLERAIRVPEHPGAHGVTNQSPSQSALVAQRLGKGLGLACMLHALRLRVEHVERLAHHALRGEAWDKAVRYLRQAGGKAMKRSAYPDAIGAFDQALHVGMSFGNPQGHAPAMPRPHQSHSAVRGTAWRFGPNAMTPTPEIEHEPAVKAAARPLRQHAQSFEVMTRHRLGGSDFDPNDLTVPFKDEIDLGALGRK